MAFFWWWSLICNLRWRTFINTYLLIIQMHCFICVVALHMIWHPLFTHVELQFHLIVLRTFSPFEEHVVNGGWWIELISFKFKFELVCADRILLSCFLKDAFINDDIYFPNKCAYLLERLNKIVPRVTSNGLNIVTLLWIHYQNFTDKVSQVIWKVGRHCIFRCLNLLIQLRCVLILKGKVASHHRKQDYTATPYVCHESLILLTFDHFRGGIAWATACRFKKLPFFVKISKAEVYNFYIIVVIKKYVFGFEIPVDYPDLVDVFNTWNNLLVVFTGLLFLEIFRFPNLLKELVATAILHNQEQILVVLDNLNILGADILTSKS